jgi:hypothetical protein
MNGVVAAVPLPDSPKSGADFKRNVNGLPVAECRIDRPESSDRDRSQTTFLRNGIYVAGVSRTIPRNRDEAASAERLRRATAQARCDSIQAGFRSGHATPVAINPDAPLAPPAIEQTEDVLSLRLADELDYARRLLAHMGDDLAADMGVVMRHSVALQSIDIVGQMLGHIANVVRAGDPDAAVELIGMGDLKARLTRRGGV